MGKRGVSRKAKQITYKPEIYEGLQIMEGKPQTKVREIVLEPKMTNDEIKGREGTYFTDKDADEILDENVDVYGKDPETGQKRLLARFRKGILPPHLVKTGWEAYYQTAAASRNRGAAADRARSHCAPSRAAGRGRARRFAIPTRRCGRARARG